MEMFHLLVWRIQGTTIWYFAGTKRPDAIGTPNLKPCPWRKQTSRNHPQAQPEARFSLQKAQGPLVLAEHISLDTCSTLHGRQLDEPFHNLGPQSWHRSCAIWGKDGLVALYILKIQAGGLHSAKWDILLHQVWLQQRKFWWKCLSCKSPFLRQSGNLARWMKLT